MHGPDRLHATLALRQPVSAVRGVSATRAKALGKMGIRTVSDLLRHYPRRYLDMSRVCTIAQAQIGSECTLFGTVHEVKQKRPRYNLSLVEITVVDESGTMIATAFQQPWLAKKLKKGDAVAVSGRMVFDFGFKRMTNPYIEVVENNEDREGKILPIHGATSQVSAAHMRRIIENALEDVRGMYDSMPLALRRKYRLVSKETALRCIHFPKNMQEAEQAKRRLKYEELLLLELFLMQQSEKRAKGVAPKVHAIDGVHLAALTQVIPFDLTEDQMQAVHDILRVMSEDKVANHMILGDVGTGKTIVAAHALAAAADTGTQAMFIAPTEVLATQHENNLGPLLDAAGVTHALLTSSTSAEMRQKILADLSSGELAVLFGTHAILEDDVRPKNMSLAVIDEQQRFGVDQRASLLEKGEAPDALYLTATPIPRSLALALYGNLTLSYIKQKPHSERTRTTHVLKKQDRGIAYDVAKEALNRSERVYVVCPLIGVDSETRDSAANASKWDESEEAETEYHPSVAIDDEEDLGFENVTAAVAEAQFLQQNVFPDYKVDLLHGSMKPQEKHDAMERFTSGESQVLVATTVIEVGVDVPEATVMIVEDADRFGLSQLHQLRGRVGRGNLDADVFYVSASKQEPALQRLSALETTDDGFELAKYDLSLRREGDVLGNKQSGASSLKLVNIMRDSAMIEAANEDARAIINHDPDLQDADHAALAREIRATFDEEAKAIGG